MSGLFKRSGSRDVAPVTEEVSPGATAASKVFPRFMAAVGQLTGPVLLDLGTVVGSNVAFFGETLGCKIHVEDLYREIENAGRKGTRDGLAERLCARVAHDRESVDGILCWDLFDYLDRATAHALAAHLVPLLKPGGLAHGLFGTTAVELKHYTRFAIEAADTFRLRTMPATPVPRQILSTRDIQRIFDGLTVVESVLLRTSAREILFKKT